MQAGGLAARSLPRGEYVSFRVMEYREGGREVIETIPGIEFVRRVREDESVHAAEGVVPLGRRARRCGVDSLGRL